MLSKSSQIVKLNVGGKVFVTSQQTLLLHDSTFFSSLINNSAKEDDTEFFIDRDPKMFSVILNYLRSNDLISESNDIDFSALKYEAMFYQLNSLVLKINLISFGHFNHCGNILFQGCIDFSEPGNLGMKNITNALLNCNGQTSIRSNGATNGHRSCMSVDLSRLGSVDDFFNDQVDNSQRLSSPIQLRASSHIEPVDSQNEIVKCEDRLVKSKSLEFTYIEGHPVNSQVTIIKCHQRWMAVCYPFSVYLYWHCDINGWRCVWRSDPAKSSGMIHKIALMSKPPQMRRNTASLVRRDSTVSEETNNLIHEALVAIASGGLVSLYSILLNVVVKTPVDYNVIPLRSSVTSEKLSQFSFNSNPIDYLVFLGGHLLAISESYPTFGFWQCQSRRWHNCSVNAQINCYSVMSDEFIILGCENGGIYQLNAQKFPLRMSDNAVLYTDMFRDPSNDSVTALDVFYNSQKCCSLVANCLEIAYGTSSGKIRIVVQHAGVGEGPKIFQTLTVHRSKIIRIVISEKYLISICQNMNHIRSWLISRFRGTINTQPGTQSLASFHLMSLDIEPKVHRIMLDNIPCDPSNNISNEDMMLFNQVQKVIRLNTDMGPYTDHMLFIQKLLPQCDRLFVRLAPTGKRVCSLKSNGEAITAFAIHQSDIGGTVNLITGHEDGSLEMWDLTTSIDQMGSFEIHHPPTAAASVATSQGNHFLREVGVNGEQNSVLMGFRCYPLLDEPSESGPTPRELFHMLREYDISIDDTCDKLVKLTQCMSYQSLHSEVSSKDSTIQRLHRSNQSKYKQP